MSENLDAEDELQDVLEEEEINPLEVEEVVAKLEDLLEKVESETVYEFLHTAHEGIASLVEWEDEDEEMQYWIHLILDQKVYLLGRKLQVREE